MVTWCVCRLDEFEDASSWHWRMHEWIKNQRCALAGGVGHVLACFCVVGIVREFAHTRPCMLFHGRRPLLTILIRVSARLLKIRRKAHNLIKVQCQQSQHTTVIVINIGIMYIYVYQYDDFRWQDSVCVHVC